MTSVSDNYVAADAAEFRQAVGHYASGITIVTGMDGTAPAGFTCQSFSSLSLDPPLVSFNVMKSSTTYPRIAPTGRFAVNFLADEQQVLASQFARSGTDKWAGVDWHGTPTGNPLLPGALAWVDCELWAEHEAGDHTLVIGRVIDLGISEPGSRRPLLYFRGAFGSLGPDDA